MLAWTQTQPGGADTLQLTEVDTPRVAPGELLVRVQAAGVNRADLVQREGLYPPPPGVTDILGLEVAGEVVALGDGVRGFAVGDAVFGLVAGGGYAEYVCLPAALAAHRPAGLTPVEAASLPEAWLTAWLNLVDLGGLDAGQRWLIHAGASGVGSAAIQLAGQWGAHVAVTLSGGQKTEYCRALGAHQVVVLAEQPDFAAHLKQSGGVDRILDCLGGEVLTAGLRCLNPDGRIVLIGLMAGQQAALPLGLMLVKRLQLLGSTLRSLPLARKAALQAALMPWLLPRLANGQVRTTVYRSLHWHDAPQAHRLLEARQTQGKLVLDFSTN